MTVTVDLSLNSVQLTLNSTQTHNQSTDQNGLQGKENKREKVRQEEVSRTK